MKTWEDAAAAEGELGDVLTTTGVDLLHLGVSRSIAYLVPTARVELGFLVPHARRLAELVRKGWASEHASTDRRIIPNPGDLMVDSGCGVAGRVASWDPASGTLTLQPADGGKPWDTTARAAPRTPPGALG